MAAQKIYADAKSFLAEIVSGERLIAVLRIGQILRCDRLSEEERAPYRALLDDPDVWQMSLSKPLKIEICLGVHRGRLVKNGFLYQNCLYVVFDGVFTDEERSLLVQDAFDAERRKFERLRRKHELAALADASPSRQRIPEEVRIAVWRRDGGCCVRCHSRIRLEYDHIVPVSMGGSNTARNIEILCESCNRSKSNNIQ